MDCQTSTNLMMLYMDNEITPDDWEVLQKHLEGCQLCQEEFTLYKEMMNDIEDLPLLEPGKDFNLHVMKSIDHTLYKKTLQKWWGGREVFICFAIYFTFLFILGGEKNLLQGVFSLQTTIHQLVHVIGVLEIAFNSIWILMMHTRRIIMITGQIFSVFSGATTLYYFTLLGGLALVLLMIENKLIKILKNQ